MLLSMQAKPLPENLFGFIWQHRHALRPYLILRGFSILAITPFPFITRHIVDKVIPASDLGKLLSCTAFALALLLINLLLVKWGVNQLTREIQAMFHALRSKIVHKLNFLHFGFLDRAQTGRLLSKYAFDTINIESFTVQFVSSLAPEILRFLLLIAVLAAMNLWLAAFTLVCLPVFLLIRLTFYHPMKANNRQVRLAREKMTGLAAELMSAIKLVRSFGQEAWAVNEMSVYSDAYSRSRESQMQLNQSMGYLLFALISGVSIVAVAVCGWFVIEKKMTIGDMVALVGALPVFLSPINLFQQFSAQYLLGAESYRSLKELTDSAYVEHWQGTARPRPLRGEIQFKSICFAYEDTASWAIENFTAHCAAGEKIALVGPSGSGKSSLINLLLGFYAPQKGEILIDGVPMPDLDIRDFRQHCALVMQDTLLLSGTILENIRFGKPDATEDEVRTAALHANALEFIEALPNGFATQVTEGGRNFSGGQRQRLAIARALLRNPKILILDEATSALDYKSESVVQEALERLEAGRTSLIIAHRLSTLHSVDRILVLQQGRLVDEGTWSELAARPGVFRQMLQSQRFGH